MILTTEQIAAKKARTAEIEAQFPRHSRVVARPGTAAADKLGTTVGSVYCINGLYVEVEISRYVPTVSLLPAELQLGSELLYPQSRVTAEDDRLSIQANNGDFSEGCSCSEDEDDGVALHSEQEANYWSIV